MTHRPRQARSPTEWTTLLLSVAIIGVLVAVAFVEESRLDEKVDASLLVTFDPAGSQTREDGHYVPYAIENTGTIAVTSAEI